MLSIQLPIRRRRSRRPLTLEVEVGVLCWWAGS